MTFSRGCQRGCQHEECLAQSRANGYQRFAPAQEQAAQIAHVLPRAVGEGERTPITFSVAD